MDTAQYLQTHAAVRLQTPDESEPRWIAHQLLDCRRFALSPAGCLALIAFMGGRRVDEAIAEIREVSPVSGAEVMQVIDFLVSAELLVPESHEGHRLAAQIVSQWSLYGWREAADYHLASFDYKFLDYSREEGPIEDGLRMFSYRRNEPEPARTKQYDDALERLRITPAKDALLALRTPFDDAWRSTPPAQDLDADRLGSLLAIAFGQLRSRFLVRGIPNLVRKTSPSGGGRHPTEGYVIVRDVRGMVPGVYHFAVATNELERIGGALPEEEISKIFYGLAQAPFFPRAFVVFTSVFERNMYRYREPRTFRTVLMDVGHVIGTLQVVARSLGVLCHAHHSIDDESLTSLLRLDRLTEGVLYGAAIGGKDQGHGSEYEECRQPAACV